MLESAFRSLMMATVVWAGIKVLRVNNVVVQKTAWILVLIAALAMPGLMRWNLPQPRAAVVVPVQELIPGVVDTPAVQALEPQRLEKLCRPCLSDDLRCAPAPSHRGTRNGISYLASCRAGFFTAGAARLSPHQCRPANSGDDRLFCRIAGVFF
jgi:hypothetical protein